VTVVRRAHPADARGIAEVKVESWRAAYVGVMPQSVLDAMDVDVHEQLWRTFVARDTLAVFVAERDDRIIGFANVGPCRDEPGIGELYAIYVRPDAWGTGAGLALMKTAAEWLGERWPEAVLWVAEENPRARRFYERCGWTVDGGRKVDEVEPGARVAEIRYRLSFLSPG
jgi:GNAT superfamily N-acetyltransferase